MIRKAKAILRIWLSSILWKLSHREFYFEPTPIRNLHNLLDTAAYRAPLYSDWHFNALMVECREMGLLDSVDCRTEGKRIYLVCELSRSGRYIREALRLMQKTYGSNWSDNHEEKP